MLIIEEKISWQISKLFFGRSILFRKVKIFFLEKSGVRIIGDFFSDAGLLLLGNKNIIIGENVSLGHNNKIFAFNPISIGKNVQTAVDVLLISGSHNTSNLAPIQDLTQVINIGAGCWIGARATILGGTTLGVGCIVAAGAVVKGKFPQWAIIGGVPAKVLKYREPEEIIVGAFNTYLKSDLMIKDENIG